MRKIVALTALVLLLTAAYADAGCHVVAVRRAIVHHQYVAPLVHQQHYNLGYSGYYSAAHDAQQQLIKDQAAFIKLQTEAYQQLRQGLTQPRAGGNAEGASPAAYENFEAFARANCLKCHQDGTDHAGAKEFVMFEADGKIAPFSIPERREMNRAIQAGEMPPSGNLGLQARQQAKQFLLGRK